MSIGEVSNPNIIDFQGLEEKENVIFYMCHIHYKFRLSLYCLCNQVPCCSKKNEVFSV